MLMAAELSLPLVVYQGLGGRHRFNSDRHHTFILQGARDAAAELAARGVQHVMWVPRSAAERSPLVDLARRAALVITEDFPAPPFPAWTQSLAERTGRPVWAVDCACIVPMRRVPGEHDRAFRFRNETAKLFKQRAGAGWRDEESGELAACEIDLGFAPLDLASVDIAEVCAGCDIDHSVPPIAHTPGGSQAGYERWGAFRDHSIHRYHKRRNAAEIERSEFGVSRLSAYLQHGHVCPFRCMREAYDLKRAVSFGAVLCID